ncbi:hypothetical protein, partial [Corallococcus llansteffanensis]
MKRSRQSLLLSGAVGLTGCLALSLSACRLPEADAAEAKAPKKPAAGNVVPASSKAPDAQTATDVKTPFAAVRRAFELNSVNASPFADNNGQIPAQSQYSGPLFNLSHAYPTSPVAPPANPPW